MIDPPANANPKSEEEIKLRFSEGLGEEEE